MTKCILSIFTKLMYKDHYSVALYLLDQMLTIR